MPETTSLDLDRRPPTHPGGLRGRPRHARPETPRFVTPPLAAKLIAFLAILAGTSHAQDAVTPERLAELVPATWQGVDAAETDAGVDASGGAFASAHYDHEDERSGRDLSLGITDLGPYRDAALLTYEADVAAGRLEGTEVAGHAAFAEDGSSGPALDVFAGRMWIRASAFGEVFGADVLRDAVASLPLDEIAALSDLPTAPEAAYTPIGFTRGALRSFLPESVLGLARADGFYARVHPTGVAWGGFAYAGEHDGEEVRVTVGIWDLGTVADASRERLDAATDAWVPFTHDGYEGFAEAAAERPRTLLYVDRFRVLVEAPGHPDLETAWLRGALDAIELSRLERLAELVPAPTPAFDPLRGQPELIDPERLAGAFPDELSGRTRGEVQAQLQTSRSDPFDTALARASYPAADGGTEWTLEVSDQGILAYQDAEDLAAMRAVEVGGRAVRTHAARPMAAMVVSDRLQVALYAWGEEPADVTGDLASALAELDLAPFRAAAADAADERDASR